MFTTKLVTVEQLLRALSSKVFITTLKRHVAPREAMTFANQAKERGLNDWNIASLMKVSDVPLTLLLQ